MQKKIDSLWTESYKPYELIKKRERIREIKFDYNFYKATIKLRSISVWNLSVKPNLFIFFYKADSIVMISPVGQEPYYIFNNYLAYAKNLKHSLEEISFLIKKANEYLLQAYKRISK